MPDSWPMALCHWLLMACWQRRGQFNHLQVQSVLYFSLYEKTGSWLTLCHPSTNARNIIKLLNISCAYVVTKTFSSSHPWGRKKKLIPFSLAALFCKQRNAYYHFVLKNVAVRKRLCACTDNSSAVTVKRSILIYSTTIYIYIYTVKPTLKDTCI